MLTTQQKKLRKLLFIVSIINLSTAFAGLPWHGTYLGGYIGGGFGTNDFSTNVSGVTDTSYFTTTADANAVGSAGSLTNDPSSAIIGIQAGHDWIYKEMVYGIILDYGALPLSSSQTVIATYPDNTDQYSMHTSMRSNWLFTMRARAGYPFTLRKPCLIYLTGGMAMANLRIKNNFFDNSALAGVGTSQTSQNQIGWTAGIGLEVAAMEHVSVSVEYLYVHLPSITTVATAANSAEGFGIPAQSLTNTLSTRGEFHTNLLKLQVNYRFDE